MVVVQVVLVLALVIMHQVGKTQNTNIFLLFSYFATKTVRLKYYNYLHMEDTYQTEIHTWDTCVSMLWIPSIIFELHDNYTKTKFKTRQTNGNGHNLCRIFKDGYFFSIRNSIFSVCVLNFSGHSGPTREQLMLQTQKLASRRSEKPPKLPPRDNMYPHDIPKVNWGFSEQ